MSKISYKRFCISKIHDKESECDNISDGIKNLCYESIAIAKNDPSICSKSIGIFGASSCSDNVKTAIKLRSYPPIQTMEDKDLSPDEIKTKNAILKNDFLMCDEITPGIKRDFCYISVLDFKNSKR